MSSITAHLASPDGSSWSWLAAGSMDVTANAAMMAAVYGKSIAAKDSSRSNRYICWAQGQIRFMLGDVVNAAVVVSTAQWPLLHVCSPYSRAALSEHVCACLSSLAGNLPGPKADLGAHNVLQGFQQTFTHSGFVRIGNHGPKQARDRGASCPNPPAQCNFINGLYDPSVSSRPVVFRASRAACQRGEACPFAG